MAVLLALAALLGWANHRDAASADRQVRALMLAQAESLADVISESAEHGLGAYTRWEDELAERLLDNARWIASQDSVARLTAADLRRLASINRLHRINLFDAAGNRVVSSSSDVHEDEEPRHEPRDYLEPILAGRVRTLRIGMKEARFLSGSRYTVAVARPGGGAVVVNVLADSLSAVLEAVRPGHLFRMLEEAHGLEYLAIQDADGILAASPGLPTLIPLADDPELRGLLDGDSLVTREIVAGDRPVFEVARRIRFPAASEAIMRIGLDPAPLRDARAGLGRRSAVRLIVFAVAAGLAAAVMLVWQRHDLLDREVRRVRAELEAQAEETRRAEKLAAMGALAAGVAHEIRNPLNTIHMIAQGIGRDPDAGDEVRTRIGHVRDESERIEKIVQQFLDFARPLEPRPAPVDAGTIVRAAADAQRAAFTAANVGLVVEAERADAVLDADMIASIVENLLRNAREASPPGGRVRVTAAADRSDVVVAVEDEGPGVPPDLAHRIFDAYFTTKASGTGLGLSLTARMASAMGGSVRLDPPVDGRPGARFVVRLPREARAA
jgi:signal transduction histidine kinase